MRIPPPAARSLDVCRIIIGEEELRTFTRRAVFGDPVNLGIGFRDLFRTRDNHVLEQIKNRLCRSEGGSELVTEIGQAEHWYALGMEPLDKIVGSFNRLWNGFIETRRIGANMRLILRK